MTKSTEERASKKVIDFLLNDLKLNHCDERSLTQTEAQEVADKLAKDWGVRKVHSFTPASQTTEIKVSTRVEAFAL